MKKNRKNIFLLSILFAQLSICYSQKFTDTVFVCNNLRTFSMDSLSMINFLKTYNPEVNELAENYKINIRIGKASVILDNVYLELIITDSLKTVYDSLAPLADTIIYIVSKRYFYSMKCFSWNINISKNSKIEEVTERDPLDIVLVLDYSGSMRDDIKELEEKAEEICKIHSGNNDKISVVAFSSRSKIFVFNTTKEGGYINEEIERKKREGLLGSTALFDAIVKGLSLIENSTNKNLLLVFTDGGENDSRISETSFYDQIRSGKIPINTFGFGSSDNKALQRISSTTNGRFYNSKSLYELPDFFKTVMMKSFSWSVSVQPVDTSSKFYNTTKSLGIDNQNGDTSDISKLQMYQVVDKDFKPVYGGGVVKSVPLFTVHFIYDTDEIIEVDKGLLDSIINKFCINNSKDTLEINLSCNTDKKGDDEYNYFLSLKRGLKIMNSLKSRNCQAKVNIICNGELYAKYDPSESEKTREEDRTVVINQFIDDNILSLSFNTFCTSCDSCNDGSAEAVVKGGISPYRYFWETGSVLKQISELKTGLYSVTIIDKRGNSIIDSCEIKNCTEIFISYNKIDATCDICKNGSIEIKKIIGGTKPFTYLWSTGNNERKIEELGKGIYYLTVNDAVGNFHKDSCEIINPFDLRVEYEVIPVKCDTCCDGKIDLSVQGGKKPYNYKWSYNCKNVDAINLKKGIYSVTVTDKNANSKILKIIVPVQEINIKTEVPEIKTIMTKRGVLFELKNVYSYFQYKKFYKQFENINDYIIFEKIFIVPEKKDNSCNEAIISADTILSVDFPELMKCTDNKTKWEPYIPDNSNFIMQDKEITYYAVVKKSTYFSEFYGFILNSNIKKWLKDNQYSINLFLVDEVNQSYSFSKKMVDYYYFPRNTGFDKLGILITDKNGSNVMILKFNLLNLERINQDFYLIDLLNIMEQYEKECVKPTK